MSTSLLAWWLQKLDPALNPIFFKRAPEPTVIINSGDTKFDVSSFLTKHPGGSTVLRQFSGKDVSKQMQGMPHVHSEMAYSLLDEYKTDESVMGVNSKLSEGLLKSMHAKITIESKIDWNKGIVCQVGSLGALYERWLDFPVDRPLKLFDAPSLEMFTRTPWYIVPIVWVPTILVLLVLSAQSFGRALGVWILPGFITGLLLWTLLEYLLHRFLFHMAAPKSNRYLITFHFLLHGLHHKVPFDEGRLVFPPLGAFLIILPIYSIFIAVLPLGLVNLLASGAVSGYVFYDLCHYYLHYGEPSPTSYFHQLKRYHAQHHFLHHKQGFGITSRLWDKYFGTEIILKT